MDKSSASTDIEISRLKCAVYDMDSLSQNCLSEITSIAKLALTSMKTPDAYLHPDTLAHAFRAVWDLAEQLGNNINSYAEEVGCNCMDEESRGRYEAHRTAFEQYAKRNLNASAKVGQ